MNRFTYRAYYQYNGPSHANPFRSEKSDQEVAEALARFPSALELFLDRDASIEAPQIQAAPSSSYVTVVNQVRMELEELGFACTSFNRAPGSAK